MIKILGFIWALPCTAIGSIIFLFTKGAYIEFQTYRYPHFQVIMSPNDLVFKIFQFLSGRKTAFTCGCMIYYCYKFMDDKLIKHEQEHVKQFMQTGVFHPILYYLSSLWCIITGRDGYKDNYFEARAREAELK